MQVVDRAMTRMLGLPPATTDYSLRKDVPVPMRDGVVLRADHYVPRTATPAGTLLLRSPYGRGVPLSWIYAQAYAQRGYHVVLQSVRGTFGSGGVFEPATNEVEDGADTVAWLRGEPWFTGTFATLGQSYLGFTQWALLVDPPPELVTAVIIVGPHESKSLIARNGGLALNNVLWWCAQVANQEVGGAARKTLRQFTSERGVRLAANRLPLGRSGRDLLGPGATWYEDALEHSSVGDEFWRRADVEAAPDRTNIPVLLIGGWQDLFLSQTLEQYRRLKANGSNPALHIGAWTHLQMLGKAAGLITRETLPWLARHLGSVTSAERSPVRIFVTGGPGWRELPDWPPASQSRTLYLNAGGALSEEAPAEDGSRSCFTYDPADPTPTIGGPLLSASNAGYRDDTALSVRDDVITFTTTRLTRDWEVIGTPSVELEHSTDNPHADVFVRLSEVDSRGRSRNVSEGFLRRADQDATVRIVLDAIAHRFRAGTRIRLMIAGGSHPHYARNLGTGEPPLTASAMKPSRHTVAHGASRLTLPVV
ncbi:hydrolase [Mycobacterium triplex]|nr:hydrolase [Mycobacterium triplex]